MKNNKKPPIGVIPYTCVAENRIYGLAEAIVRSEIPYDIDLIKRWAKEIVLQCDLVKEIDKEMDKDYAKARRHMV